MKQDILLVEDNPDDIHLTMEAFRLTGIDQRTKVVRTGEDALKALFNSELKHDHWTVIFLDLNLPGISGTQVLEKIRANPQTETIPVVMLTSSTRVEDKKSCYLEGVNSYISKPVNFDDFIEVSKLLKIYWTDINNPPE